MAAEILYGIVKKADRCGLSGFGTGIYLVFRGKDERIS